jgi:hypothetical protein
MSGIQKRTVFMVIDKSHTITGQTPVYDFLDWASCVTSVGQCMEPFLPNNRAGMEGSATKFEPRDMMAMINKIDCVEPGRIRQLIGNVDDHSVHSLTPQVLRQRP